MWVCVYEFHYICMRFLIKDMTKIYDHEKHANEHDSNFKCNIEDFENSSLHRFTMIIFTT